MSTATGTQNDARFETSAAWAEAEASSNKLASQVEQNAHQMHDAAEDAATKAQYNSPAAAVDNLEHGLSEKTDQAVAEGQGNVQGYVTQAKNLANSVVSTAQSYMPSNGGTATTAGNGGVTAEFLQSTASSAVQTTKQFLIQAQNVAAPVASQALGAGRAAAETAKMTATPYVQSATDAVSQVVSGTTSTNPHLPHTNSVASNTAHLGAGSDLLDSQSSAGDAKVEEA